MEDVTSEINLQEVEVVETTICQAENILVRVIAMKDQILDSISKGKYLSEMHSILTKQIQLPLRDFADWKNVTFPDPKLLPNHLSYLKLEISEMLISWYKEAKEVNMPMYLFTDEERELATFWDQKAIEYVTKVLYHVVINILLKEQATDAEDFGNIDFDKLCMNWGGRSNNVSLENTCTVDNLITIISLNMPRIQNTIAKIGICLNADGIKLLDLIETKDFNSTRCWLAERVNLQKEKKVRINFYGSEQRFVHFINSVLGYESYQVEVECWSCCSNSQKSLNLTSINNFVMNCQSTLDYQIQSNTQKCMECRDSEIEIISQDFSNVPVLFMMEMNHLWLVDGEISSSIQIKHGNTMLDFSLLGYSVYSASGDGHFFSYLIIGEQWYMYDGMRRPKLCKENLPLIRSNETFSTIMYLIQ